MQRRSTKLTIDGVTRSVRSWAQHEDCSVSRQTIYNRLDSGWSAEDAVFRPAAATGGNPCTPRVKPTTTGGQILLDWCDKKDVTLPDVAKALGVSYSTIMNLLNGNSITYRMVFLVAMLINHPPRALADDFGLKTDFDIKTSE